jgi:hypothetical protein
MRYRTLILAVFIAVHSFTSQAAPKPLVGVYYFDGWADRTAGNFHIKTMPTNYAKREPLSGWYDDRAELVHQQVVDARSAGIDFCCRINNVRPFASRAFISPVRVVLNLIPHIGLHEWRKGWDSNPH